MSSRKLTMVLSEVGNDIPTRLGKSRPTLTLGASEWIPLYANQHIPESTDEFFLISALVPEDLEEDILSGHNWEISVSSFRPGYTITMMVERIFRMSCRW